MSCPTAGGLCVAVDDHGDALTYDGTVWSEPTTIDATHALVALSCPTVNFCVAVYVPGTRSRSPRRWRSRRRRFRVRRPTTPTRPRWVPPVAIPPYRWLANLPRGLRIGRTTGVISGTPRRTGTFMITVTVRYLEDQDQPPRPSQDRASVHLSLTVS